MSIGPAAGQALRKWIFENDRRFASLDFEWSADELEQIHRGEIPGLAAAKIKAKWKRVAPRLLKTVVPITIVLFVVWLVVRGAVSGRGESLTVVYILGAVFLLFSLLPLVLGWFRYSPKRKLSKKTVRAKFLNKYGPVQFGLNQERKWDFSKEDLAELVDGGVYVVYSAGDQLVYLEEVAYQ